MKNKGIRNGIHRTNRQLFLAAGLCLIFLVIGVTTAFNAKKDVTVYVNGNTVAELSSKGNQEIVNARLSDRIYDVLTEEGLPTGDDYEIDVDLNKQIKDVDEINIKKKAEGVISVDGVSTLFKSAANTVEDVIKENELEVKADDIVEPALTTALTTDIQEVKITRVTYGEEKGEGEIPFETENQETSSMAKGVEKVITEGVNGKEAFTDKITYHDGVEFSRERIETQVIEEPVKKVVEVGTNVGNVGNGGDGGSPYGNEEGGVPTGRSFIANCTAYTHTGNPTASGVMPVAGVTVAADPSVFPLGTRIYIPYFNNTFIVQDTGGAVKGNVIDIFMDTYDECVQFGRRDLEAYVVD